MSDRRKPTFLCENTLKANGEGGDKRVTRDSLNNMPFALYTVNVSRQLDKSLRQLLYQKRNTHGLDLDLNDKRPGVTSDNNFSS